MKTKFKIFLSLGLIMIFFVCGGPNCIPDNNNNVTGNGPGGPGNMNSSWMNIIADQMSVQPNSSIGLRVEVGPPENGPFYFEWSANNGNFDNKNAQNCRWTAPNFGTGVNISCMVKDARGGQNRRDINVNVMGGNIQPPATNEPPNFTDVHSEPSMIPPGGRVRLVANANDPNFDMINFNWKILNGPPNFSNPGPNSQNCDWMAPMGAATMPSYEFVCVANDGKGGIRESGHVFVYINNGPSNNPPNNINLTASKVDAVVFDEIISLSVTASDPENDPLMFNWFAKPDYPELPVGQFLPGPGGPSVTWKAPYIKASQVWGNTSVYYTINCMVDDGHAHIVSSLMPLRVQVMTDTAQ